ncbi:MAG: hypoxanthine phosphoribosyltransferase [Flavobacterium sp.]|nr:hypoxanthine phosphoribosyltransferase [Flavobacterium sp.]
MIALHDKEFVPFISNDEIKNAITKMAKEIEKDFKDDVPVFVGVLNGSFMVVAELASKYHFDCEFTFVRLSSYDGIESTGKVKKLIGLNQGLAGRSVVIVEDIVDTGTTVLELKKLFKKENVKCLKFATLFFKPEAYRQSIKIDYIGIDVQDKFIVGYGLDYKGLGRNLQNVYQLK